MEVATRMFPSAAQDAALQYWRHATAEYYHYDVKRAPPEVEAPKGFHPTRGWSDFSIERVNGNYVVNDIPGSVWRSPQHVAKNKRNRRIVIVGDSFVYGWSVENDQTIDRHLSNMLGGNFEIINLGVRGYGLDQMALVVLEAITVIEPDAIVIGLIGDDLSRSCSRFSSITWTEKPFLIFEGSVLDDIKKIETPYERYVRHRRIGAILMDYIMGKLHRSRFIGIVASPILRARQDTCIVYQNTKIVDYILSLQLNIPKLFVHLDGNLPDAIRKKFETLGVGFVSAPNRVELTSKNLQIPPERHEDGHPKGGLNKIYASIIHDGLIGILGKSGPH